MLFNTKFDLIISIGEDCACTSYLRRCKLQDYSYPFDWLTKASFNQRIKLIVNDFKNWFNKDDFSPLPKKNPDSENEIKYDLYENIKTDFYYYHDFPANESFDSAYPKIKEKYDRRINRMYEQIAESKKILFVWWSRNKHISNDEMINSYHELLAKFPNKQIFLLSIEYASEPTNYFLADNHILVFKYDNISYKQNKNWNETMGNEDNNLKIFSQIKKRKKLKWYLKYLLFIILKLFINIVPISSKRKKLRKKLKKALFKEAL